MTTSEPLSYATPPAFVPRRNPLCPICNERPVSAKTLYGHAVCKKCLYRFANRRQLAYVVDSLIFTLPVYLILLRIERSTALAEVPVALVTFLVGIVVTLIFILRDGIDGRSPGKRLAGVQVVDVVSAEPISFAQSFKRNWWFLLGLIPIAGGFISLAIVVTIVLQMNKGPRLGDRAARTRVIWKRYADRPVFGGTDERCRSCNYDLTGNESGRCPECGEPAPAPPVATATLAAQP